MPNDYYPILFRAATNLENNDLEARRTIYERARQSAKHHWEMTQIPKENFAAEQAALEEDIHDVEMAMQFAESVNGQRWVDKQVRNFAAIIAILLVGFGGFVFVNAQIQVNDRFENKMPGGSNATVNADK